MTTLEQTGEAKRLAATLAGGIAVLLWSLLALFTTWASGIPPFQLVSLCFSVAALIGFGVMARKGRAGWRSLRQPAGAWALGTFGLFGYHFFYFMALGNAPAVEAGLIAYLWPLLIVVFSALLPGERLRWFHLAGALLALAGAALLVTKGQGLTFDARYSLGYLAAIACALTWSTYSVANRRFGSVPTETVAGFCAAAALLGFISHGLFETWVTPTIGQWGAILLLGLGPVGAAFFVWDYGTKHGHIQALGAFAYAAPLLSTLLLIAFGQATATWSVALACVLIVGGAVLASLDLLRRR
ncbi:aromatic amino acid exporter YddG [Algihabitans albus]|uniref:aromatic amino acid exporter YddG n=1 Tax=Algihabitans albus TaxID=2164067 RepID=UPI000E5D9ADB|nr:EamA family transporter [Algihabitans albus]